MTVASHERWQRAKVRETRSAFPFKHLAGAVALVLPRFVRLTLRTAGPNRLALRDPDEDCETGASLLAGHGGLLTGIARPARPARFHSVDAPDPLGRRCCARAISMAATTHAMRSGNHPGLSLA